MDSLLKHLCGLSQTPSAHTLGRWLRGFDDRAVARSLEVNERPVGQVIEANALCRLLTGRWIRPASGFRAPGYDPVSAHVANTGQVLRKHNRVISMTGKPRSILSQTLWNQQAAHRPNAVAMYERPRHP